MSQQTTKQILHQNEIAMCLIRIETRTEMLKMTLLAGVVAVLVVILCAHFWWHRNPIPGVVLNVIIWAPVNLSTYLRIYLIRRKLKALLAETLDGD